MAGRQDTRFRPYVSKFERARKRWIDYGEGLRRLEAAGCSHRLAIQQISFAILEGSICWMWEDQYRLRAVCWSIGPCLEPLSKFSLPASWNPDAEGCLKDTEGNFRTLLIDAERLNWCFDLKDGQRGRPGPKGARLKSDDGLVAEALGLLDAGTVNSRNHASVMLAPRAKGQSVKSNERRLNRKIGKALRERGN